MSRATPETVEELIVDTLATFGPEKSAVTRDATLDELDLDSLDVVELAQVLEDELGMEIKADRYEGALTVGDLIDRTLPILRDPPQG